MQLKIEIDMNNESFKEDATTETVRLLRQIAADLEQNGISPITSTDIFWQSRVMDPNGNCIGLACIT